jgi:hypothetical protein
VVKKCIGMDLKVVLVGRKKGFTSGRDRSLDRNVLSLFDVADNDDDGDNLNIRVSEKGKNMDQIHRLLQESIFCYRKLMEVYERLRNKISTGGSSEKLDALLDQSRELNTMVQFVDRQFQKLASDNQVTLEDIPLFLEWKALLNQVREENKLMRNQLQANMAILNDDLCNISRSKKGISGYRSEKKDTGKQINIVSA